MSSNFDEFIERVNALAKEMGITDRIVIIGEGKSTSIPDETVTWNDFFDIIKHLGGICQERYIVDAKEDKYYGFYQQRAVVDRQSRILFMIYRLSKWHVPIGGRISDDILSHFTEDRKLFTFSFSLSWDDQPYRCTVAPDSNDELTSFDSTSQIDLSLFNPPLTDDEQRFINFIVRKVVDKRVYDRISKAT